MKLKALSLALLALPFATIAETPATPQPSMVSFNVEEEKEIDRDLLQVNLFYQTEGKNLADLNKTISERLNKAIALVKQYPAVEIKGNSRNTMVQYDNKGKKTGWVARADFTLESKDSQALSDVVSALDDTLAIANMSATVSSEKLMSVENELTQAALEKFKNKATLIQNSLQMKNYRVVDLDVSSANERNNVRPYYATMAKSAVAFSESSADTNAFMENGKETVRVRANARIELLKD